MIDVIERNPMSTFMPVPDPVAFGWEIAKVFIGLMDVLRNHDDLSCSRTFVLTRDDMTVLSSKRELEWNFNGDGHHKLTVRYEGERPTYPTGSLHYVFRSEETGGEWSAPVPLNRKTQLAPRAVVHDDNLHVVYASPDWGKLVGSWYDGTAWSTTPLPMGSPGFDLIAHEVPVCYWQVNRALNYCHWDNGWQGYTAIVREDTAVAPSLVVRRDKIWMVRAAFQGRNALVLTEDGDHSGREKELVRADHAFGAPSMAYGLGRFWVTYRLDGKLHTLHASTDNSPISASWSSPSPDGDSDHDPVLHFDGTDLWRAHVDKDGTPCLSRRTNVSDTSPGSWSDPTPIGGEPLTVLGTPGLATYKGRLYAFYHS